MVMKINMILIQSYRKVNKYIIIILVLLNSNLYSEDLSNDKNYKSILTPQESIFSRWHYLDEQGNGVGDFEFWNIVDDVEENRDIILTGKTSTVITYAASILWLACVTYYSGANIFNYEMDNDIKIGIPILLFSSYLVFDFSSDIKNRYMEKAAYNYNIR